MARAEHEGLCGAVGDISTLGPLGPGLIPTLCRLRHSARYPAAAPVRCGHQILGCSVGFAGQAMHLDLVAEELELGPEVPVDGQTKQRGVLGYYPA
jgi:hypothetical protein